MLLPAGPASMVKFPSSRTMPTGSGRPIGAALPGSRPSDASWASVTPATDCSRLAASSRCCGGEVFLSVRATMISTTPITIGVVLIIVALTLRKTSPPQHREEAANLEQSVAGVTEAQLASEGLEPGKAAPMGRPLPVGIVLEEGNFTIEAGPAGSSIRVEGDYDAGAYELKQELAKDGSGQPHYTLSFRSRRSMFHRLLTEGGVHIDKNDNRISIFLPRGIPIALDARIRIGTSHLNLGGLALSNASLDLSMGEHTITCLLYTSDAA